MCWYLHSACIFRALLLLSGKYVMQLDTPLPCVSYKHVLVSKQIQPSGERIYCYPALNWTVVQIKTSRSQISWRRSPPTTSFPWNNLWALWSSHHICCFSSSSLFLSLSLIKPRLAVEACSMSCFIYGRRCVCTAGLGLWLFWSSFIRGCSIFISAVSPLFYPWIAPICFWFWRRMTIQALSRRTFVRKIYHLLLGVFLSWERFSKEGEAWPHVSPQLLGSSDLDRYFTSKLFVNFLCRRCWVVAVSSHPATETNRSSSASWQGDRAEHPRSSQRVTADRLYLSDPSVGIWIFCCLSRFCWTWKSQTQSRAFVPPPADRRLELHDKMERELFIYDKNEKWQLRAVLRLAFGFLPALVEHVENKLVRIYAQHDAPVLKWSNEGYLSAPGMSLIRWQWMER